MPGITFCPQCGASIEGDKAICPCCGAAIGNDNKSSSAPADAQGFSSGMQTPFDQPNFNSAPQQPFDQPNMGTAQQPFDQPNMGAAPQQPFDQPNIGAAPQQPFDQPSFNAVPPAYNQPNYGTTYNANNGSGAANGCAIAGMVLGILSVVLFCLTWVDAIIAIVGLVLSCVGIRSIKYKGCAIAGLACSIVGVLASLIYMYYIIEEVL